MTALLKALEVIAWVVGIVLALPGLPLLILATLIQTHLVAREEAAHQHALDLEVE